MKCEVCVHTVAPSQQISCGLTPPSCAVARNPRQPRLQVTSLPYPHMLCAAWCGLPADSPSSSGSDSADCACSRAAGGHPSAPLLQQNMLILPPPIQDHQQVCFKPSTRTILSNLVQTGQHLSYRPLHQQSLLKAVFGRGLMTNRQRVFMS